ncbi:MAG: hypothetical protein H6811_10725 [Phycisphaeraceae bacterium]|nr:hypothetical protein [Phycisphaeraceae bacterium]
MSAVGLFGLILGLLLAIGAAFAVVALTLPVVRAVGIAVGSIFRFVGMEISDSLRLVGSVITSVVLAPFVLATVILGRWSAAAHFGRAIQGEVVTAGACVYRMAIGHPAVLFRARALTEGIERRLPEVVRAAPGRDRPSARVGQFQGYTIVGSLSGGGSGGKLYVAEPDAIKQAAFERQGAPGVQQVVIKSFSLQDGSTLPQIIRESRALDAAKKMGLVLEHELTNDRFFYVMRFVPGESLAIVTHRMHAASGDSGLNDSALRRTVGYIADVLQTLTGYHEGGLWHKDIKPDNIIVDARRAQIVDLGLVTPLRSNMTLTTHGTEYFRDPELVRLALKGVKVHQVDGARFDVYATGAVLFSVIENSFPAHGVLSPLTKRCPEAMKWIIRRAMADYDKRYPTARAMLDDVRFVAAANDPFGIKPIELPSMSGAPTADPAPSTDVEPELVGAAGPALGASSSSMAGVPSGPRLRIKSWWQDRCSRFDRGRAGRRSGLWLGPVGLFAHWDRGGPSPKGKNEGAEEAVASARRGSPIPKNAGRPSAEEQRTRARERANAARERARQRRAARRTPIANDFRPGVNVGVAVALVMLLVGGGVVAVAIIKHRDESRQAQIEAPAAPGIGVIPGQRVPLLPRAGTASVDLDTASDVPSVVPAASRPQSGLGSALSLAAAGAGLAIDQTVRGSRVLVVCEVTPPLSTAARNRIAPMLTRLHNAGVIVLADPFHDASGADQATEDRLVSLHRQRELRSLDSRQLEDDIGGWLRADTQVDFVVWIEPEPQRPGGVLVQLFGDREQRPDWNGAARLLAYAVIKDLVRPD